MAKKTLLIACVLAGLLALAVSTTVSYGRIRDIFDSSHDLGSPGNPTCRQCHIPHKADGRYLWARQPAGAGSVLQSLCFSCHDGSVTSTGWYLKDPRFVNHPTEAGEEDKDCDQCHNAHEGDNWKFVREYTASGAPMVQDANVCATCHKQDEGPQGLITGAISHPVDQTAYSVIDRTRNPNAVPPDFSGTRLFDSTGTQVLNSGPGEVKCASCHTPHGAFPGAIPFVKTEDGPGRVHTLSTMSYSEDKYSPICENCHE